jgi:Glycosyl hydrolases family 2, sugar binding domain/Glycosyl hydrolases family 2/Glycosyl hydrolases family 2, TIM barrel domain
MDKLNKSNESDNSPHMQPIERRNFLKWMAAIGSSTGVLASTIFAPITQAKAAGWSPKKAALMTRWASQVSPTNAWPLYPRPQMTRPNWLNLNGVWQFEWSTGSDAPPFGKTLSQSILVPYPIESALSGIMAYKPYMWYRTTFTVPVAWKGQRVILRFDAVDWQSTIYINGQQIGRHSGGYDGFSWDITPHLNGGLNELIVHVYDPTDTATNPHIPVGKQRVKPYEVYFSSCSGIWQTVWLEPVPSDHIVSLDMIPDIDKHVLRLTVTGATNSALTVVATASSNGVQVGQVTGIVGSEISIPVPNSHLWSPDDPFLYDLQVSLMNGSTTVDHVTSYFGMRKISLGKVGGVLRPLLNNKFVFQMGLLDHGYWPDGIYTQPTEEALKWDLQQIKALGFNTIRKHMKVEPARYYYWADKLGLMIWQDMPAIFPKPLDSTSATDLANFQTELQAMVTQHKSYTSIIQWTPFNEHWGQPASAATVHQIVANIRSWDPSRLIDEDSGYTTNPDGDAGAGDILDLHAYIGPASPTPTSTRVAYCGEFGAVALKISGHDWPVAAFAPVGYVADGTALTNKYVSLIQKVQSLMSSPGMSAAIYNQITDVEGEVYGLQTYDRAIMKPDTSGVIQVNQTLIATSKNL